MGETPCRGDMWSLRDPQPVSWGALLAASTAAQLWLALMLARGPLPSLTADEALHALAAASTWHGVEGLDLRSLYLDIYDQGRWPPLGGVLQWPALAVFGLSEATHRLGILMWLVAAIAAWAAAARAAAKGSASAAWAGIAVASLALSSQTLLAASVRVLYEVPGLALMLGAYAAAHTAWQQRRARLFWLGSLLLAGAWFTKWQYGIVATLALIVAFLRQRRVTGKTPGEIWLFAPSAVLLALWLASPYHVREMVMYLLWKPASAGNLGYYAVSFLRAIAQAPLLAKANVAATVVGLVLAAPYLGSPTATALATHLALATVSSGLKDLSLRTGLWIAIPAWALAAAGWGRLIAAKLPQAIGRTAMLIAGAVAVLLAVHTAVGVSRQLALMASSESGWHRPAAQCIAAQVPLGARLLTVGGWSRYISPYHVKLQVLCQNWDRRFAARDIKIAEYPSFEWEPWRIWRPSLRAVIRLRRPDIRPLRPKVAPDYVAVINTAGGTQVAKAMSDLRANLVLEPIGEKTFPGATVHFYRCRGWRSDTAGNTAR